MAPTDPASAGPDQAGNPADKQSAASRAAPAPGAAETIPAAHTDAENTGIENAGVNTGVDSTDRPGDIPYDQAAAEHENPALE
jgi:hypothetical protein